MYGPNEVTVPVLALLAEIDGIQKIRAGVAQADLGDGTEVPDCKPSTGGSARKKNPTGVWVALAKASSCLSVGSTSPPSHASIFGKRPASRIYAVPGSLTRPAQKIGADGDAVHNVISRAKTLNVQASLAYRGCLLPKCAVTMSLYSRTRDSGAISRFRPGQERVVDRKRHTSRGGGGCRRERHVGSRFPPSPDPPNASKGR